MNDVSVAGLYDVSQTRAAALFCGVSYPWAAMSRLSEFLAALCDTLSPEEFEQRENGVFVARDAQVADNAILTAPCIVDHEAELRCGAFLRGGVLVGRRAVVGNSCEVKNAVLFDRAQVPHFNYIGDSVIGYCAHFGAGAVTSNLKSDRSFVTVKAGDVWFDTGRKKVGAFVGDGAEIGCGAVLCPGAVIGKGATVYPQSVVRGFVPHNHIYKTATRVVKKEAR